MNRFSFLALALVALVALFSEGCSKKAKQTSPSLSDFGSDFDEPAEDSFADSGLGSDRSGAPAGEDEWSGMTGEQGLTDRPYSGEWSSDPNLATVYFAYNRYDLSSEARRVLSDNVSYLRSRSSVRVLLEGHCDERGTEEYNQALGENRALAVREYLISQGISPSRIDIISYGELRPAMPGSGESAWSQNRRVEFKVAG